MKRNVELLEATMQHILDHPELHDQSWYFTHMECGTACCFAGWTCLLAGKRVVRGLCGRSSAVYVAPGSAKSAFFAGRDLLGLTDLEAAVLFDGGNTRPMLELMVKDLVNGADMRSCDDYREEAA